MVNPSPGAGAVVPAGCGGVSGPGGLLELMGQWFPCPGAISCSDGSVRICASYFSGTSLSQGKKSGKGNHRS